MGKLADTFRALKEKWGNQSKVKKFVIVLLTVAVIGFLIYITTYLTATKYAVLFKDMDSADAANVVAKLKTDKTTYKVSGTSILVPQNQVDSLRMDILSSVTLTNGSQGWELLDNSSKFGVTDEQMKTNYQRALQGELERTIKSFPQIDNARVIIVPSEDSAFVKDSTPASASVALKLKTNQNLTKQQVSAIISLLSGSVKNLPKENVQVIDDKMRTLSSGIFDKSTTAISTEDSTDETASRQALKAAYEKSVEDKITEQLSPVYKDGVKVTVNADLDFDASQTVSTTVSNGQVVSEHNSTETDGATGSQSKPSASPVDNNMTSTTPATTTTTTTTTPTTKSDSTKNYELSKSENTTIKAPGDINKISASVVINGNIDDATKTKITNLISSAIGYDATRGDSISVEGLPFDTSSQTALKKVIDEMNATAKTDAQNKLYTEIGIGVGAIVLAAVILILVKKRKKNNDDIFMDMDNTSKLDKVLGDELVMDDEEQTEAMASEETKDKLIFKPIEFEKDTEDAHVEREVKKYAIDKPDQVADIIKSWLADDER